MRVGERWIVIGLACACAFASAMKPLHVDEPFMFYVARHIVASPLDPFGLEILSWQWPQPVYEYLLPPVLAYWGAIALALGGSDPFWWKLSLLPWVLVFAFSFFALARRFTPGCELPLLAATLLSPLVLPGLNYMTDVPALALGLAGLASYLRAEDRGSVRAALAAGVVVGLALQTKYAAFAIVGAVLVHGALWRRGRLSLLTAATGLGLFALWEWAMTIRYGQGMFLGTLSFSYLWSFTAEVPLGLVQQLGPTLAGVALLGLAALGLGRRWVAGLGCAVLLGHGVLLVRPIPPGLALGLGGVVAAVAAAAGWQSLRGPRGASLYEWIESRREALFLVLWLMGEAILALLISPFPAARRLLGVAVAMTFVVGRLVALSPRRRLLPVVSLAALQVVLGVVYFATDFLEARAQRDAAREAFGAIHSRDPTGSIWFVGHWGFQAEALRLGMRSVIPDHSRLELGDWLLVPDRVDRQDVRLDPGTFRKVRQVVVEDGVSLATLPGFYSGALPLVHHAGPRLVVDVYRTLRGTVPESGWTLESLIEWAILASGSQAGWAARALGRELLRRPHPRERRAAAQALGALGPRGAEAASALAESATRDPHPVVRADACDALRKVDARRAAEVCDAPGP